MHKLKINDLYAYDTDRKADALLINGEAVEPDISKINSSTYHIINNLKSYNAEVISFSSEEKTAEIKVNNNIYKVTAKDQFDILLEQMGLSNLNAARVSDVKAPMPGLVLKVFVTDGVEVKKGDNLFVLEAMKMENIIKAPADGTIKSVKIKPGDKVEKGQVLLLL